MLAVLLAILLLLPAVAHADEITVKGDTLKGTVKSLTGEDVEFETVYGKGTLSIPYADVERLDTEGAYRVFHGGGETRGRLTGVEDGAVVLTTADGTTERIATASIDEVYSEQDIADSFATRLHADLPYWSAEASTGLSLTRARVDTTAYAAGFRAERKRAPTRFLVVGDYTYSTQKEEGQDSTKLTDDAAGQVRFEYDFAQDWFAYGNGTAEYDAIQRLSIRGVPEAGLGYRLYETKDSFWSVYGGGAWVYERYFDGTHNDYASVVFGTETELALPYDATFRAGATYLPALDDWQNDYLIRSYASLSVPVWKMIAMKASLVDDYDSTPAPDTPPNSLSLLLGLALTF
ncbi:MAG: DUF481 domain-containing protein [bacterium]|nr:DUF481 domain-containing protein [bacterium]